MIRQQEPTTLWPAERPAGWAALGVRLAAEEELRPGQKAAALRHRAEQAARSAPHPPAPWPAVAPLRARWLVDWARAGQAALQPRPWWRSPSRSQMATEVAAAGRCLARTAPAMRWAPTGRRSAQPRPRAARWYDQRSARWQCCRAPRGPAAPASAVRWPDWDRAGPHQAAAAVPRRSCRLAGHATSSPGSSMRETMSIPPASAHTVTRSGGNAGQRCRIRGRNQLEPAFQPP